MIKIFSKTILKEYYRQNVMFFAAVFFIAGVFMRGNEHKQIAEIAVKSPLFLVWVMFLWALYNIKVILFTQRILKEKTYEFLYQSILFSKTKRLFALAVLQLNLLGLSVGYSAYYLFIALVNAEYLSIFLIIIFDFLMIVFGVLIYENRLHRPNSETNFVSLTSRLSKHFLTPHYLFFIRHLFTKQPILLLSVKLASWFFVSGMIYLYPTDDYDVRLFSLGGLFVFLIHVVLCQRLFEYEFQQISFVRNLPFSTFSRFLQYGLVFLILLIPEIIVFAKNIPTGVSLMYLISYFLFALSLIILTMSCLFLNWEQERFGYRLFWYSITTFVLIMFKVPILLLASINYVTSFYILQKYYYDAEYIVREN
ncbi:MAG: hypothetical protein MUF45_11885 [Spirosomaceae bacterium]|jgi:hypothetical protein|nr:hypothetical protein [Spirosomataceae bacterium]